MRITAALTAIAAAALAASPSASAQLQTITDSITDPITGADTARRAETHRLARQIQSRAIAYLESTQDARGLWSAPEDRPALPAITGLALDGMLLDPRVDPTTSDSVRRAIKGILSFRRPDGLISDGILPTYNTAICVSALSRVRLGPGAGDASSTIAAALPALRSLQWGAFDGESGSAEAPDWREAVTPDHPYYGGAGYGRNGRPDMSNTQFFLQALADAGVSSEDPAVQKALVFLARTQMDDRVNDMDYADGDRQGGFIYATTPNAESLDPLPGRSPGQSQAGEHEVTLADGTRAPRHRAYGSMTYAGFKSLIFADLPPDDLRLTAAYGWISTNWTLETNPGMTGEQRLHGYYYYLASLARALDAWEGTGGDVGFTDDWRAELVRTLADLQQPDGSFAVQAGRWMEDDTNLIAAYALIAVGHAAGDG